MRSLKYSISNETTTSMKFCVMLLRGILISENELLISFSCMVITVSDGLSLFWVTTGKNKLYG